MINIQELKVLHKKLNWIYQPDRIQLTEKGIIKLNIVVKILDQLILILEQLNNNQNDLQKLSVTLRYCLETTIVSELLVREKHYFLKLYYALNPQHEKKIQTSIDRVKKEISFLNQLNIDCEAEIISNTTNAKEIILKKYKSKMDNKILSYIDDVDKLDFNKSITFLEEKLNFYKDRLKEIQNEKKKEICKLSKEDWFREDFNQEHQHTKILKQLEDKRNWRQKSTSADLEEEYLLTYEETSSLLHFTSYSVFTEGSLVNDERKEAYNLISQYINKIVVNLESFMDIPSRYKDLNFVVLDIPEEIE